jgi:Protein of unknown function (DUF3224)
MIRTACGVSTIVFFGMAVGSLPRISAQARDSGVPTKGPAMSQRGNGTFEVKLTPMPTEDKSEGATLGRMTIDKQYHGDLEAKSKGEMLTAGTSIKGSAGYVAIEKVTGTLKGRNGTFALQHSGTMTRGAPQLTVTVVPDSGTGQLTGLVGKMTIKIADGKHSYEFEYSLPDAPAADTAKP